MSVETGGYEFESRDNGFWTKFGKLSAHVSATVKGIVKGTVTAGLGALGVGAIGTMALGSLTIPGGAVLASAGILSIGKAIDENRKVNKRY
ncbi:hypothetical protein CSB37_00810 [bacterium DOLZORAL124_38_8]|nr:MAG: hypothetical protein CSB37_00810 [bacterium DOLZORAL124_38_8]